MHERSELKVDLLIIGGGIAGLLAAIHALREHPELQVLVVDKGTPGASGASAFAAGIFNYWQPGDKTEEYVREIVVDNAEYLIDQQYVRETLVATHDLFQELVGYGVRFIKDAQGQVKRVTSLGTSLGYCSPYDGGGPHLMWKVRGEALRRGARFLGRTMIVNLLRQGERCAGAVGFGLDEGRVYTIQARAVILAAGTLQFYKAPLGSMGAGDGAALALRAGVKLRGMEQVGYAQIGPKGLGAPGLHIIFGCGGILINARGERFMRRYQPKLMEEARRFDLARAILQEWIEGRGPCYLDCTHLSEDNLRTIRLSLPLMIRGLAAKGLEIGRDKIEYIPYGLALSSAGGVRINDGSGATSLPGLWTVGYAGDYCGGVMATAVGSLSGSGVQGRRAGVAAARWLLEREVPRLSAAELDQQVTYLTTPWEERDNSQAGKQLEQLFKAALKACFRHVNLVKDARRLQLVITEAADLQAQLLALKVGHTHHLKKWHELNNILQLIPVIARASLMREESRRAHFRSDFPRRDDCNWLKWVLARQEENGGLRLWTEEIPLERWTYRPDSLAVDAGTRLEEGRQHGN